LRELLFAANRTQVTSFASSLQLIERELKNRIKHANTLSLSKGREDQAQKKSGQKRDSHFRYCATM